MEIILVVLGAPFPCAAAENRDPVVGGIAVVFCIGPDIPVFFGGVGEPWMLVGGVGEDEVDDDLEVLGVGGFYEPVEILERSEHWVDVAIVGDVITEIFHRGGVEGADPYAIHAEVFDVGEFLGNAVQVAGTSAGGVVKAAWVDLVEGRAAPCG